MATILHSHYHSDTGETHIKLTACLLILPKDNILKRDHMKIYLFLQNHLITHAEKHVYS